MTSFGFSRCPSVCSFLPSSLKATRSTRTKYGREIAVDLEASDPRTYLSLCPVLFPSEFFWNYQMMSVCSSIHSSLKDIRSTRSEYGREIAVDLEALASLVIQPKGRKVTLAWKCKEKFEYFHVGFVSRQERTKISRHESLNTYLTYFLKTSLPPLTSGREERGRESGTNCESQLRTPGNCFKV